MTRDDIIRMAHEADMGYPTEYPYNNYWTAFEDQLIRFAQLVAAAEREECAKVCDELERKKWAVLTSGGVLAGFGAIDCAATIRARGQQ